MKMIGFVLLFALAGCTDAQQASLGALGSKARITCHSGGRVIYDGCSTGKVSSNHNSDGYGFKDAETQRYVDVSGECFIDYDAPCPKETLRPGRTAPADAPAK